VFVALADQPESIQVGARCDIRTPIGGKVDGPRYVSNQGLSYASMTKRSRVSAPLIGV
jgi:hypothetical protein